MKLKRAYRRRPGFRNRAFRPGHEMLEKRTVLSLNLAPLVALPSLTGFVAINGVAVDSSGDTYVTGSVEGGSTNINPDGSAVLSVGIGSTEGFLAKYSPAGQFLWDQVFYYDDTSVGLTSGSGNGLTLDAEGNPIVTGTWGSDVYVAKYFSAGEGVDWSQVFGTQDGDYPDSGNAVAVDPAGNIYVAGYFSSASLAFGGSAATLTRQGVQDGFVVKLSPTGSPVWSWDDGVSGDFFETLRGIAVDSAGETFVTGQASNGGSVNSVYIAKLSASGSYVSGGIYGIGSPDTGAGVAIDAQGDVYVLGTISSGTVYWGSDAGTVTYTAADNLFLLRMNESGTPLNVNVISNASGTGVAVGDGGVYMTGSLDDDEYLYAAFGPAGSVALPLSYYGPGGLDGTAIAVNASGQIALAGAYSGTLSLDRGSFPSETKSTAFLATSGTVLSPPSATTGTATSISTATAALNGSVNPEGSATMVSFVYGTNPNLSSGTSTTAQQSIGSGTSAVPVTAALTGLAPATTYYYEAVATSAAGTADGSILNFTTAASASPPAATTESATAVTSTTAMLNGSVNSNGGSTNVSFELSAVPSLPANIVTTLAGLDDPFGGVAVDSAGNVYVADTTSDTIEKITPSGVVTTLAGSAGQSGSADGTGAAARFDLPQGAAVDSAGNVYVADTGNDTIRKITPAGVVTTLAGSPGQYASADGTGAAARFDDPAGLAVDSAGNVYVADTANNTIRKISPAGVVTTLAGTAGEFGSADGTGAAARFNAPYGVAVDSAGNVYVADGGNDSIRKITPSGVVTTLAGTAGEIGSADGTGAAARFSTPFDAAVDSAGNVYVADTGNNTIRKITPAGVVTTLAGTAGEIGSTDGTGAAARFDDPTGVAVDSAGNVYVADTLNQTIRKLAIPTVLAQSGVTGTSPAAVSAALTGLTPDTTYYYHVVATNANGTTDGSVLSFVTPSMPSTAATPTINWVAPAAMIYGTALGGTQLDATAAFNGLAVDGTFNYSPAWGTVLGAGSHTLSVSFTPTDTTDYKSVSKQTTLVVNPAIPVINWPAPAAITYGTAVGGTQLDAGATFDGSTVPGTFTYSPPLGTVLDAGSYTLSVNFTPTDTTDYNSVSSQTTLVVNPVTQAPLLYGNPLANFAYTANVAQMKVATGNALATEVATVADYRSRLSGAKAEVASLVKSASRPVAKSLKSLESKVAKTMTILSKGLSSEKKLFKKLQSDLGKLRSSTLARREDVRVLMTARPAFGSPTIQNQINSIYNGAANMFDDFVTAEIAVDVLLSSFKGGDLQLTDPKPPQPVQIVVAQGTSFTKGSFMVENADFGHRDVLAQASFQGELSNVNGNNLLAISGGNSIDLPWNTDQKVGFSVDTANLHAGTHFGQITLTDNRLPANTLSVPIEIIVNGPQLGVKVSASATQVQPGQGVTYTFTYSNTGTTDVTLADMTATIPSELMVNVNGVASTNNLAGQSTPGFISDVAPLPAGDTVTVTVQCTANSASTPETATINATISSSAVGANPSSDSASVTTTIVANTQQRMKYTGTFQWTGTDASGNPLSGSSQITVLISAYDPNSDVNIQSGIVEIQNILNTTIQVPMNPSIISPTIGGTVSINAGDGAGNVVDLEGTVGSNGSLIINTCAVGTYPGTGLSFGSANSTSSFTLTPS